jgi:uncharacterized protein YjiS (DUF1127 family)
MACKIHSHMLVDRPCQHLHNTSRARSTIRRSFAAIGANLELWNQRSRQRQALRELDDHELSDIGITRQAADREAQKWFWQR